MTSNKTEVYLSVIVPAYNEEARILKTLDTIDQYLKKQPHSFEVIVVDDGSTDQTSQVVLERVSIVRSLRLIRHATNEGKGWAVRSGMLAAEGTYRLFMDADNSTTIDHWPRMQDKLLQGFEVVVGSRHVPGATIHVRQILLRETLGYLFRLLVRILFFLPVADTQNGFKAFTARAAKEIFSRQRIKGWAFDVEILALAKKLGFKSAEVPVTWINDEQSRLSLPQTPLMLIDLFRIKLLQIARVSRTTLGTK